MSGTKVFAHITPHSAERGKLITAAGVGSGLYEGMAALSYAIVGLRDALGWSEYLIYVVGACIFTLPAIITEMGPSFVLQRVPQAAGTRALDLRGLLREVGEGFRTLRYNRYLLLDLAARFLTTFTPGIADNEYYRYMGVDKALPAITDIKLGQRRIRIRSEFLLWVRDNVVSAPGSVLQPFSVPVIRKAGGPRNMQVIYQGIATACYGLRAAAGMKTPGAIVFSWVMETVIRTFGKVQAVAGSMNPYEMLDYVEWKTGRRSEGMKMAVDGILGRLIINNVDTTVGNLVVDALGFNAQLEDNQPAAYQKWAPWLYLIVPTIDNFIMLIARLLYQYPASMREQVEADLIERRALAEQKKAELEESLL